MKNHEEYEVIEKQTRINELECAIIDAPVVHKRLVYVKPIAHHYENPGEKPYIKWSCPICEAVGNQHRVSFKDENCMLCGIHLTWEHVEEEMATKNTLFTL